MDVLDDINMVLEEYRSGTYDSGRLREMRSEMSVLLTMLGDIAAQEYEALTIVEYERKKQEDILYEKYRAEKATASDAERRARIANSDNYYAEASAKGTYRRLENMRQALLKVLDSMAAKMKDHGEN
jgi:hypothetical protein